jgi:hypothetical protein
MSENSATSNHKDPASTSQTDDDELVTRDKDQRPGLMKILGKAIGLDITTIAIPVTYNEPTSFLQRMMEYLTYSELLDKANKAEDPDLRTLYVTLFVISSYATTERTSKPFNPLLGETYEYVDPHKGLRFFAEQVSHHPPIGACIGESPNFEYVQDQLVKTKFLGNSLEVTPQGHNEVRLKATNERFVWDNLKTVVHNIIIGRVWIDHFGDIVVQCREDERKATLKFKACGWFSKGWHEVDGTVFSKEGKPRYQLHGKWNESIYVTLLNTDAINKKKQKQLSKLAKKEQKAVSKEERRLRKEEKKRRKQNDKERQNKEEDTTNDDDDDDDDDESPRDSNDNDNNNNLNGDINSGDVIPKPTDTSDESLSVSATATEEVSDVFEENKPKLAWRHNVKKSTKEPYTKWDMNEFGVKLIELTEEMKHTLPPTDSRLRKDRLALEQGDIKRAKEEKYNLEEQQRQRRRQREIENITYRPRYFEKKRTKEGEEYWAYVGHYWEEREERIKKYRESLKQQQQAASSTKGTNGSLQLATGKVTGTSNSASPTSPKENKNPTDKK